MTTEGATILVAILGFAGTLFGSLISASKTQAVMEARLKAFEQRTDEKFKEVKENFAKLEAKQDKHNNMIERVYSLEGRTTELEHDVRDIKAKS